MTRPIIIRDVTELAAFEPAIKLRAIIADPSNHYFRDYILTKDLADVYASILSSIVGDGWGSTASTIPSERRRSHLISAQYGTGKSYFLTILSAILGAAGDFVRLQATTEKFADFSSVPKLLGKLSGMKFLVIQISAEDKGDIRCKELLVRSLLDCLAAEVPGAVVDNEYIEAARNLEQIEAGPISQVFGEALFGEFDTTFQQLQAGLSGYDREALRSYYKACERVFGRKVSRDVLELETTFRQAARLLHEAKGYTHIALLVDELTTYLRASAAHHPLTETLAELQTLATYCNRPDSHCLFVGAMHVSARDFLRDYSQEADYEKMKGRFEEHPFPVYSSRLLAGILHPNERAFAEATQVLQPQVDEISEFMKAHGMADDGRPMLPSAIFPLHPAVALYLPRVARELGQAERTSFGFVDEVVRPKMDQPLIVDDRLNLVTLDQVFDYFLPAMEQREYYLQVIAAYNVIQSRTPDRLAHAAFKPLALLWIASRVRLTEGETLGLDVELTYQQVASYLNIGDDLAVVQALKALCETKYVYYDSFSQHYFYSHADPGWDLDGELQKAMQRIDANDVLKLELTKLGQRVCLNAPATLSVIVERTVSIQQADVAKLKQMLPFKPKTEAAVIFVVPTFMEIEGYAEEMREIAARASALARANIVVAVPKRIGMLNATELRRLRAVEEVGKRLVGSGTVDEHRVRLLKTRLSNLQPRVQSDLEAFGQAENFTFYINQEPHDADDLNTVLREVFEYYYHKFPPVKVERINGRSTINALIEECILNVRRTFAGDTSEVARQARDTLRVLGLCTWQAAAGGQYVVELKEPTPGTSEDEIWQIALGTLTDIQAPTPLGALYKRLADPPYGLPDYMVELYIASAIALKRILIVDDRGNTPAISKALTQGITRSKDKQYRVLPVQKSTVPYVYVCSVWEALDEPLGLKNFEELKNNLGRPVEDQRIWLHLKQDARNLLENWLSRISGYLKALDLESPQLSVLSQQLQETQGILPAAQGFQQLAKLGQVLSGLSTQDDPDGAARFVRDAIRSAKEFSADAQRFQQTARLYKHLIQNGHPERFPAAASAAAAAWEACRAEPLGAGNRNAFTKAFAALWRNYAESYVEEHNTLAAARRNYGRELETSLAGRLVAACSNLQFEGIVSWASLQEDVQKVQRNACDPLGPEAMLDYQQYGRTTCASCEHSSGSAFSALRQLRTSEEGLVARVNNALTAYLDSLLLLIRSDSVKLYWTNQAAPDEVATLAAIDEMLSQPAGLSEPQSQELLLLIPRVCTIAPRAQQYARQEAQRSDELRLRLEQAERERSTPRLPVGELAEEVRTYLLDAGLEAMTQAQLREYLLRWMEQLDSRFHQARQPERPVIGESHD